MNLKRQGDQRRIGVLFLVAVFITLTLSIGSTFKDSASSYDGLEPTELSPADKRLVIKQTAKFCQEAVPPATQPFIQPGSAVPVLVFAYHRVTLDKPSHVTISPALFEAQVKLLHELGYTTITISQLTDYMNGKIKLPKKTVALTFDDGWKDNVEAAQVLAKYDMAGTFYIISGFFTSPKYVNEQDVKNLSSNPKFEIGAHSHTHFKKWEGKLAELDLCTMAKEIAASKVVLERLIKREVPSLAWPYGHSTTQAVRVAEQLGFKSTTHVNRDGRNLPGQSPLFIRRLNIDGSCSIEVFKEMLNTGDLKECS